MGFATLPVMNLAILNIRAIIGVPARHDGCGSSGCAWWRYNLVNKAFNHLIALNPTCSRLLQVSVSHYNRGRVARSSDSGHIMADKNKETISLNAEQPKAGDAGPSYKTALQFALAKTERDTGPSKKPK